MQDIKIKTSKYILTRLSISHRKKFLKVNRFKDSYLITLYVAYLIPFSTFICFVWFKFFSLRIERFGFSLFLFVSIVVTTRLSKCLI